MCVQARRIEEADERTWVRRRRKKGGRGQQGTNRPGKNGTRRGTRTPSRKQQGDSTNRAEQREQGGRTGKREMAGGSQGPGGGETEDKGAERERDNIIRCTLVLSLAGEPEGRGGDSIPPRLPMPRPVFFRRPAAPWPRRFVYWRGTFTRFHYKPLTSSSAHPGARAPGAGPPGQNRRAAPAAAAPAALSYRVSLFCPGPSR